MVWTPRVRGVFCIEKRRRQGGEEMSEALAANAPALTGTRRLTRFETEFGSILRDVDIAYETYGELNPQGDNVIVLCHALTGDAHAGDGKGKPGWWGPLIGPGRALDTERYFVVCANALGGCSGSTGPASVNPETSLPYGSRFPVLTIRDMVKAERMLLDNLGVQGVAAVIGGSLGGMRALEWAAMYPEFVERVASFAATPVFSAMGIAYNEVMRAAIVADPQFMGGDYVRHGRFPAAGLRIARMLGMITYRTAPLFAERFGRMMATAETHDFEVARYLRHHGDKLAHRFDAGSYLTLLRAMDLHDLSRDREDLRTIWQKVRAKLLFVGVQDDLLYPPAELMEAVRLAREAGVNVRYAELASGYGHDAFLLEFGQIGSMITEFLG